MRKILSIFAVLLIIPSLAFASIQSAKLTDQQYSDLLINSPINESFDEDGFAGTVTAIFNKNGTFKEHVSFKCPQGSGTWDLNATWSVKNAVLHMHVTDMSHSDTHNKELNSGLDELIADIKSQPDFDIPLDADGFGAKARTFQSYKKFRLH